MDQEGRRANVMGLRFYRRVRILPGLSVNFSRSGPSLIFGVRGRPRVTTPEFIPGAHIRKDRSGRKSRPQRRSGW